MRNVLKNTSECAHFWAHGIQDHGRANSVRFEGRLFYSYNAVIGIRFDQAIVVTGEQYSVTTSSHTSEAWRAAPGTVVRAAGPLNSQSTPESLYADWAREVEEATIRFGNATRKPSRDKALREGTARVKSANAFADAFGMPRFPEISPEAAAELAERRRVRDAERAEAERRKQEVELAEIRSDMEAWKVGGAVSPYRFYRFRDEIGDLLRLSPTEEGVVETSQHADVPLADVQHWLPFLLPMVRAGEERDFTRALVSPRFGHYAVRCVAANGTVFVGCHRFHRDEIERFIATLPSTPCVEGE